MNQEFSNAFNFRFLAELDYTHAISISFRLLLNHDRVLAIRMRQYPYYLLYNAPCNSCPPHIQQIFNVDLAMGPFLLLESSQVCIQQETNRFQYLPDQTPHQCSTLLLISKHLFSALLLQMVQVNLASRNWSHILVYIWNLLVRTCNISNIHIVFPIPHLTGWSTLSAKVNRPLRTNSVLQSLCYGVTVVEH